MVIVTPVCIRCVDCLSLAHKSPAKLTRQITWFPIPVRCMILYSTSLACSSTNLRFQLRVLGAPWTSGLEHQTWWPRRDVRIPSGVPRDVRRNNWSWILNTNSKASNSLWRRMKGWAKRQRRSSFVHPCPLNQQGNILKQLLPVCCMMIDSPMWLCSSIWELSNLSPVAWCLSVSSSLRCGTHITSRQVLRAVRHQASESWRRLCVIAWEVGRRRACYRLGVLGLFTLRPPRHASRRASGSCFCVE